MTQQLNPARTTWHITFGAYGARLHGDERPTVDLEHNQRGEAFVPADDGRSRRERDRMKFPPVRLTREQCLFIQEQLPQICERGGWTYRTGSAGEDHVHALIDMDPTVHGEKRAD